MRPLEPSMFKDQSDSLNDDSAYRDQRPAVHGRFYLQSSVFHNFHWKYVLIVCP